MAERSSKRLTQVPTHLRDYITSELSSPMLVANHPNDTVTNSMNSSTPRGEDGEHNYDGLGDVSEIEELGKTLASLRLATKTAELKAKIEKEKDKLRSLQLPTVTRQDPSAHAQSSGQLGQDVNNFPKDLLNILSQSSRRSR